jgi:hypothetical protein
MVAPISNTNRERQRENGGRAEEGVLAHGSHRVQQIMVEGFQKSGHGSEFINMRRGTGVSAE